MALSPSGRIRINVTGARGALGIDIQGTPQSGQYLVKAPGGGRTYTSASGTGADVGLREDLAGPNGASYIGYDDGNLTELLENVEGASFYASYVTDMRQVLRRDMPNGGSSNLTKNFGEIAYATYKRCRQTTSTGEIVMVPDGANSYGACWIRDWSMSIRFFPNFMTNAELLNGFKWYMEKCEVGVQGRYRVPDHITLDGTIYWTPGYDNNWGTRASTDGEPMLVGLAWAHYIKSGSNQLYADHGAALKALMDNLPTDATTKGVYVPALPGFVTWGFIDTVGLQGTCFFGSVLNFIAYRQLADMAWDAGDYTVAFDCIDRAIAIKNGLNADNANLWSSAFLPEEVGCYKFSNGNSSPGVLDIWGSALACWADLAPPQRQLAFSRNLAANFDPLSPGQPAPYVGRGGIRHTFRSTDFQPGSKMWQQRYDGSTYNEYERYQSGACWMTPLHWVSYALGLTRSDLASELCYKVLAELSYENRPGETIIPNEWVSVTTGEYGVPDYLTSAAALLSLPQMKADMRRGARTRVGMSGAQTFPAGQTTKVAFNTPGVDDMLGSVPSASEVIIPADGDYRFAVGMYFAADGNPQGGPIEIAVRSGGNIVGIIAAGAVPSGQPFSPRNTVEARMNKGDRVYVSFFAQNNMANTVVADSYTFFQISPING